MTVATTTHGDPISVLIVENEPVLGALLGEILSDSGYDVSIAGTGETAIAMIDDGDFDVIVADKTLPGVSGIEVIRRAKAKDPQVEAIVMTAYPSGESIEEAYRLGVLCYLTKPFDNIQDVRDKVAQAISRRQQRAAEARTLVESQAVFGALKK